ncbi:PH domain-containing protein [Alteromonas sp. McT4-15]|uniref:PH domain-containing protein n=1 Tax=Alteromonas sp. McT4-15 TaxID=2881256 RepID=UPI001CF8FA06|nr:PH domain-containing protein [Alteromonas sp. McT4-15]MCB4438582.1 PH domain-containing protein [Alteromonas sp. McT4-15]
MSERIIISATFNPAVKTYWLISLLLVSTITVVGIPVLIISIPLFFLISSKILAAMSAIVTERKLVVKRGVFNKEEKSIPLEKITDVAMVQGPLMRIFNLYRLSFETAGQSAQGALVSLIGINDADTFRETILAQKDKLLTGNNAMPDQKTDENNDMKVLIDSVKRIELLLEKVLDSK